MTGFDEKYNELLAELAEGKTMVLSSCEEGRVSSRMMSVVCIDGAFYFQTDRNFRKYRQLTANPYGALCVDNLEIEGVCRELGRPMEHPRFCQVFRDCFPGSFRAYSALENERLFVLEPILARRWLYIDGAPHIESFDIENREYRLMPYEGV